jgi:DNA polymerase-1
MKVLLVDGNALAYRAHFAFLRNPLVTSRGEPSSVAFGFLSTLWRWLQNDSPDAVAVVFDPPGPTHRHRLFRDYKAQRPPRPPELAVQMPRLHAALAALRVGILEIAGWEADDVLATLATQCEPRGDQVLLASGDKDFRQLLSANVHQIRPGASLGEDEEIGPEELAATLGLGPAQIVDLMALCGDSVDNIPGVAGIGEKTAAGLLREHTDLDRLYAGLESLPRPGLRERLRAGREAAFLSRELVRLRTDAPVDAGRDLGRWPGPDWTAFRDILKELEMVQLLRQLPARATPEGPAIRITQADDAEGLAALAAAMAARGAVALHAVTRDATPGSPLVAIGFATEHDAAWVVPIAVPAPPPPPGELDLRPPAGPGVQLDALRDALGPLLASPAVEKRGQDLKQTARRFEAAGLPLAGALFDTQVAAYVLAPERHRHDLEALALEYLDERAAPAAASPNPAMTAAGEAARVWRLHARLAPQLEPAGVAGLFTDVEMPLLDVLRSMEREGVAIDAAALRGLSAELLERSEARAEEIFGLAGRRFNLQSPTQLGQVLFGELHLPHGRRTRNGWSTDADVLERLAAETPIGAALLEYRQLTKLRSTYAEALPRLVDPHTGRIHTRFNQTVAATGRLSSSDPNLQNIPARSELGRRIRAAFVARDRRHRLLSADYSQIELRLMAHLSEDAALAAAFARDVDVHTATAARLAHCEPEAVTAEMRAAAKMVNFGVIYGMGPRGLADRLGIPLDEARRFIDDYFASYAGVRRCTLDLVTRARATGYATTLSGRRLRLPDLDSDAPARRAAAERVAINAPIQGSAADLVKLAMVRVQARLQAESLAARLVLQVHDELVFDVPESEVDAVAALVRAEMVAAMPLRVPLVVDVGVGTNWAEAH